MLTFPVGQITIVSDPYINKDEAILVGDRNSQIVGVTSFLRKDIAPVVVAPVSKLTIEFKEALEAL